MTEPATDELIESCKYHINAEKVAALIARIRQAEARVKVMDEALEILIDPDAGEVDRNLAIRDARAARKEPTDG